MSEQSGEKTEQATPRKLEEAIKKGQFARSSEVQTVFVLAAGLSALSFSGPEMWHSMASTMTTIFGHLHEWPVSVESIQEKLMTSAFTLIQCVSPVVLAAMIGGMLAGGIQSRFQTAPEALSLNWGRMNPVEGFKRVFSPRAATPALLGLTKVSVIILLCQSQVKSILEDPIFFTAISAARISEFMAESALKIGVRVGGALICIAAVDYAFQFWKTNKDMMMSREEIKEESKSTDANPQMKAARRRRKKGNSKRKMLAEVPKADVIVTNPTHLAIALRYDRKTMKAPQIIAKGSRLNALEIREIARLHQVPIVENKPLARLMFRYGKVGGEIPAQLYAAVAEVLAWVYRVNRYRYYTEQNQV